MTIHDQDHDLVPAFEHIPVDHGVLVQWWGGPSLAFKTPHTIVYLDPFRSMRQDDPQGFVRAIPNVFFPESVTRADVILSTHNHLDHCDRATLTPMTKQTNARLVVAPSSYELISTWEDFDLSRVTPAPEGTTIQVGDVTLTSGPSRDWEDKGAVTFVLQSQGVTIFIGGDTLYFDGLAPIGQRYSIDLSILALANQRRDLIDAILYANPQEIAQAARDLRTKAVLPVHWDIWEAWRQDPTLVAPYLEGSGITSLVLKQGDTYLVTPAATTAVTPAATTP